MKKLRMKRLGLWLTVALCLALGLCLFVGCTPDGGDTETDPDTSVAGDTPTEEPTAAPTEEPTEEPEPHVHSYTESVIAATCITDGVKTFTCECGDSYIESIKEFSGTIQAVELSKPSCVNVRCVL